MRLPFTKKKIETRDSLSNPSPWLSAALGGESSAAGVRVDVQTAYGLPAFWSAVRLLSDTVASLPLVVYQRTNNGKRRAYDHPLYRILHDETSPNHSAFTFREVLQAHLLTHGNAYAQVIRNEAGQVISLMPLQPQKMEVKTDGQDLWYVYGNKHVMSAAEVLHVVGLGFDGLQGYSPVKLLRDSIGLGMAAQQYGAKFYANNSTPSGVLATAGRLSDEGVANLRRSWESAHRGANNANKVAILEEGLKWQQISVTPADAAYIETKRFSVQDVARIMRVPVHMLGDLHTGASYASIEQSSIEFEKHSVRPWLVRWEQAITRRLLGDSKTYFVEFVLDGLLRGDTASRVAMYQAGIQNGWMSINDVRTKENMNRVTGGDEYLRPLNMAIVGEPKQEPTAEGSRSDPENLERPKPIDEFPLIEVIRPVVRGAADRIVARESTALSRSIAKYIEKGHVEAFAAWLVEFSSKHSQAVASILRPIFDTAVAAGAQLDAKTEADFAGEKISNEGLRAIMSIVESEESTETASHSLRGLVEDWRQSMPSILTQGILERLGAAIGGSNGERN